MTARMREMWTSIERSNGFERMALERIHDLVAREHAARALRQHDEQVELVAGEVAGLAVEAGDARAEVDLEAAEAQHVVAGRLRRGAGAAAP